MDDSKIKQPSTSGVAWDQADYQNKVPSGFVPGISKEFEKAPTDFLKPSEMPVVLDKEVKDAGIEVVSEKPVLTNVHAQAGITHSLQNVEPNKDRASKVEYPLNDQEVDKLLNEKDKKASAYWLSVLITKLKKRIFSK